MNTEEEIKKLRRKVEKFIPLLSNGDSLKFACIPLEEGLDSTIFMDRIEKTNRRYPYNRCLFIACYESGSLKIDYKVRELESILTIRRDGKLVHRRVETDLGLSPAEIRLISMILHVKAFIAQHKQLTQLKTDIAGEKRTQHSTISRLSLTNGFFILKKFPQNIREFFMPK